MIALPPWALSGATVFAGCWIIATYALQDDKENDPLAGAVVLVFGLFISGFREHERQWRGLGGNEVAGQGMIKA